LIIKKGDYIMSYDEYYNEYLNDGMDEDTADQLASLDAMIDEDGMGEEA
jgi:hypothetical protein